ncbi:MAG TPA: DnaD domain protein [Terrisporobacter glycolicus]|uniref:phage replisome organizer N-terminal domain-containing protein n=1 Tax=Terrisporobacter TaxID=1505652 RepID=UPI000E9E8C96|nr:MULTISPECIES: phage replisome organizer N-terminal domain-containing protein [Terrisporobacter]HBI91270.1 DnaD domain protein [Terrisporobacter hibernicus]
MSKNKKYYWLKLKEDFFEEDTINWIEEQENGKDYCLFYLKLCLKSLKTNGTLIRNVGTMLVPYDAKQLGKITNTDIDTVRVAMELFKKIGLVEVLENGEIYLTQLENMVGSETSKAQLMRKKRAKDKDLPNSNNDGNNVTNMLPSSYQGEENCYTEIETEQEKETEQEIDLEQELEKELEQQQDIERKDVVGLVSIYFPYLNEKDLNTIVNEFLKTNKDLYYLSEKLILTTDAKNIENKVGYLLKAIKEDYQIRYATSLENLVAVWEQELLEKPNNPIVSDKVKYYRFKCVKKV